MRINKNSMKKKLFQNRIKFMILRQNINVSKINLTFFFLCKAQNASNVAFIIIVYFTI